MTIKEQVLAAIQSSRHAVFAEDITHLIKNVKLNTVVSAAFDLVREGKVKAARKNRQDHPIACVYFVREDQIAGMEGLMPYEPRRRAARSKGKPEAEDVMIAIPLEGNKTDLVTIGQAYKIYKQLRALFEKGGA